jgi:hypothetical protein
MTTKELETLHIPHDMPTAGPTLWKILHTFAKNNEYDKNWVDYFASKIPCGSCRMHFSNFTRPARGEDFFKWTVDTHNAVNKRLGKPEMAVSNARMLY